jgi:hypothetical protein
MPGRPDPFKCPLCGSVVCERVIVPRPNGTSYTTLFFACAGCSIMFLDPLRFTHQVLRTRNSARYRADREHAAAAGRSTPVDPLRARLAQFSEPPLAAAEAHWYRRAERPIGQEDVRRYVVGRGLSGWAGGIVTDSAPYGLTVQGEAAGGPFSHKLDAGALSIYTFMSQPPPP